MPTRLPQINKPRKWDSNANGELFICNGFFRVINHNAFDYCLWSWPNHDSILNRASIVLACFCVSYSSLASQFWLSRDFFLSRLFLWMLVSKCSWRASNASVYLYVYFEVRLFFFFGCKNSFVYSKNINSFYGIFRDWIMRIYLKWRQFNQRHSSEWLQAIHL